MPPPISATTERSLRCRDCLPRKLRRQDALQLDGGFRTVKLRGEVQGLIIIKADDAELDGTARRLGAAVRNQARSSGRAVCDAAGTT